MSDLAHAVTWDRLTDAQHENLRAVLHAVDTLVDDLVRMDNETAIALESWPAAAHLIALAEPVTVTARVTGALL